MVYYDWECKRSKSFYFTADLKNQWDVDAIDSLKSHIRDFNKKSVRKYRIMLRGRLGKNNPNAWKYKKNRYRDIRLEDAGHVDVYIYERKST